MAKSFFYITSFCLIAISSSGQKFKKNTSPQITKEDANNEYHSDKLSNLDMIQAFEALGIHVYKFDIGIFDTTYRFITTIDEFINGKMIKTDTLLNTLNTYSFYEKGVTEYYWDYIDQIKVITKQEILKKDTNTFSIHLQTYGEGVKKTFKYAKRDSQQFYSWVGYLDTQWKINKKIPLLIFASSWYDKKYDIQRFCGARNLKGNDPQTIELLSSSPRYYLVSYKILRLSK
jgi:hypothetical protein